MGKQRSKADIPVNVSAYSLRDVNETLVENRLRDSGFKNVPRSAVQSIVARGGIASKDRKTGESINIPVASLPTQKTYETIKGDVESASELFFQGLTDIPVSVSAGIQQMLAGTDKQKLDAIRKWQDNNTNQLSFAAKRMLENEEMSIEKFMFTAGNTVGQIVSSMATAAAGTAIGATAGTAVGGPVGTVGGAIGGFLGGMAVNMPFMYNSLLNSAEDAGIDNVSDRVAYAYGTGIGLAALESVPLSKIAGWTAKSVAPSLTKSVLNKMTTKYGAKSANELIERIGADKFNKEVAVGVYKAARNGIADRVIGKAGAVGMGALAEGGQEITEFYLEKLAQATYDSTRGEGKQAGKGAFGTQFTQEEFFGKKARDEAFWNGVFGAVGGGFAGTVQAVSSPLYKTGVYDTIDTFVKRGKTVDEAVAALNGIIDRRISEGELAQDVADTAKSAIQNVAQSYNKIGGKFQEPEFRYVVYERVSKKDDLVKELGALESKKAEIQGIIAQNQGDADIYTVDMMEIDKLIDQKQRQLDFTSTWLKDYTQKYYDNKKAKNNTQGQFIDDSINDFIVRTDSFDKKKQTPYEFAKEANDAYNAGMKDIDLQYDSQVKSMNMSSLDENIDPDFDEIDTVKTKVRTNPSSSENPEFADVNIAIDENGEVAVKRETEDGALSYVRIANTPQYEPVVARAKSYFENRDSFEGIASKLVLGQELTEDEAELYEDFADNIDGIKTEMQQRVGGKAKDALLKMNAKPIMEALQNMAPTVQRYQERISEIDETLAKNESIPASNQDLDSTKVNEKLSASEVAKLMQTKQDLLDAISKYNNELQRVTEMNPDDSSLDELDVKELAIYQAKMAEVDVLFNEMVERFYKNSSSNLKKFYEKNDEFDFLENMEEYAKSVAAQKRLFKSSYDKNLASKIGEIVTKAKILEAKMQENRAGIEAAKQKQEEAKAAKEQIKLEKQKAKEAQKILKEAKAKLEQEKKKGAPKTKKGEPNKEEVPQEQGVQEEATGTVAALKGTNEKLVKVDSQESKDKKSGPLDNIESTTKALNLEGKSTDELNSAYDNLSTTKDRDVRALVNLIDNIQERNERKSILNAELSDVISIIDGILKQDSYFIEKADARQSKVIVNKYLGEVSKEDAVKDFKDAFFGNPDTWIADSLKMRESVRVYIENGGTFKDILKTVQKEFENDGFSEEDAAGVIERKLGNLSEKDLGQQRISEAYHKAKKDGSNPEFVDAIESLLGGQTSSDNNTQVTETVTELEQVVKEAGDIIIEAANNIEQIRGELTNEQQLPTDSTENESGVQSVQTPTTPISGTSETTLQENVTQGEITPEGESTATMATDATESIVPSGSDDTAITQGGGTQTQLPNVSGDVKAEAERLKNSIKGQFKILSDNNKTGEDGPDYIDPVSTKLGIASEGEIEVAKEGLNGFFYTKLANGIFGFVHQETGVILETNKSIVGLRKSIKDKQGKTDASIIPFRAKLIADANKALENYIKERDNVRAQKQQEEAQSQPEQQVKPNSAFELIVNDSIDGGWPTFSISFSNYKGRSVANFFYSYLNSKQKKEYDNIVYDYEGSFVKRSEALEGLKKLQDFESRNKDAFDNAINEIDEIEKAKSQPEQQVKPAEKTQEEKVEFASLISGYREGIKLGDVLSRISAPPKSLLDKVKPTNKQEIYYLKEQGLGIIYSPAEVLFIKEINEGDFVVGEVAIELMSGEDIKTLTNLIGNVANYEKSLFEYSFLNKNKGKFTTNENLPEWALGFARDLHDRFTPKSSLHIISKDSIGNMSLPQVREMGLSSVVPVLNNISKATHFSDFDNGVNVIVMGISERSKLSWLEIFSHEFGHHIQESLFYSAPKTVQDAIIADYNKWLNKNKKNELKMISSLFGSWMPKDIGEFSVNIDKWNSKTKEEKEFYLSYISQFDEWFAQNTSQYVVTNEKSSDIVSKFFSDIADKIKALYDFITRNKYYSKPLNDFLDAIQESNIVRPIKETPEDKVNKQKFDELPEGEENLPKNLEEKSIETLKDLLLSKNDLLKSNLSPENIAIIESQIKEIKGEIKQLELESDGIITDSDTEPNTKASPLRAYNNIPKVAIELKVENINKLIEAVGDNLKNSLSNTSSTVIISDIKQSRGKVKFTLYGDFNSVNITEDKEGKAIASNQLETPVKVTMSADDFISTLSYGNSNIAQRQILLEKLAKEQKAQSEGAITIPKGITVQIAYELGSEVKGKRVPLTKNLTIDPNNKKLNADIGLNTGAILSVADATGKVLYQRGAATQTQEQVTPAQEQGQSVQQEAQTVQQEQPVQQRVQQPITFEEKVNRVAFVISNTKFPSNSYVYELLTPGSLTGLSPNDIAKWYQEYVDSGIQTPLTEELDKILSSTSLLEVYSKQSVQQGSTNIQNQSPVAQLEDGTNSSDGAQTKTVDNVIEETVTSKELEQVAKEQGLPNKEEAKKAIKNEVLAQMNEKSNIKPKTILQKIAAKVKRVMLNIMAVASIMSNVSFSFLPSSKSITYDNIKIDNLSSFEDVKLGQDELNKLDNINTITKFHEGSNERYIVVDKNVGVAHLYEGGNLITSYQVGVGENLGDEQTQLSSKFYNNRGQEVSANEATYSENGNSYVKDGYSAKINWDEGNKKTGAGIYLVSKKGSYKGGRAFYLKNERGQSVATALHKATSAIRQRKINDGDSTNNRFSNGCVNFNLNDLNNLASNGIDTNSKVYILPDNPNNEFKIVDGKVVFTSKDKNVNRTPVRYIPQPIAIKAKGVNQDGKDFLVTLSQNKAKIMALYPTISNDEYNQIAKIAYGIFGQESSSGTFGGVRGQFGRVRDAGQIVANDVLGTSLNPSLGVTQIRFSNIRKEVRKTFGIDSQNALMDTDKSAIATMAHLLDIYVNEIPLGLKDKFAQLLPLAYSNAGNFSKYKSTRDSEYLNNQYVKNVNKNAESVSIYIGVNENIISPQNRSMNTSLTGDTLIDSSTGKVSNPDIQNQLLEIKRNGSMTFDSGSQKFFNRFAAGIERIFPGVSIGALSEQDWIDSGLSPSSRGAFNRKTGQVMLRESMYDGSTFVHEVGHAIMKIIGDVDTNLYNAMLDAVEGTKYEAYVRDNYPNLTTREEILSEAMGYAIQDKGVKMQSRPMAAFRDMMTKAFNAIKKFMGYRTNKDIGDMTLDDFTSEVAGIMFGIKDADIFLDEFDLTQNAELNNYFETEGNTDESSIQYQYFKFQANQQQVAKGIMRGSEYATFSGRVSAGEATMQETIDTLKSIVDSPILESQMASALTTGSGKDKFDGYSFIKANLNDFATDYYNIVTNTDAKNLTPLQNSDIVELGNTMLETYADQHKRSHIEVVQDGKQVQVFVDPAKEASNVNKNVRSFFDAARAKGIMTKYTAKFLTGSMFSNLSNMDTIAQMLSGDNGIMKGIQDLRVHMNKVAARVHNGMRKAIYDATEELTQIARNRGRVSKLKEGNFKPLEEEVNVSFHNNFTGDAELGNSNLTLGQLAYIYLARQTQVDSDFQRKNAGLLKSIANLQKEIDKAKKIGNSKRVSLLTTEMDAKQLELKNLKRDLDASDIIYDPTVKDGSHLSKYVISNNKRTNRGISFELENEQKVTILLTRDQMKVIDDMFENGGKYEEEMKVLRRFWSSDAVKNVFTEANEVKYRIEGGRAQEVFGTYIPIRKDTADSLSETSVEPNVKNMRFVLERTGLAGRIVGLDMFSIMNEYMEQNTEYIANAEYRDSLRTYRNSLTADDTSKNRLVSGADMEIVDAINTTLKGIDDMVRSIDSGLKSRRDANRELDKAGIPHRIYNLILSNFSKAVFSFNLGNLFKQSAGYLAGLGQGIVDDKYIYREVGYIGKIIPASMKTYITNDGKLFGKDFNGFFKVKAIEREMEYLEKHEYHFADILRRIQDESAYTGNIELDSLDFVLRKKGKLGDVYRAANKTIFKGLSAMRMNDAAVIIAFVRAARAEVTDLVRNGKLLDAENNPITDVESPKALRLIAEKASELVYRTNNMYMENDKTPLQRSNNILHKSIGLFSSQPQKISNLFAQRFMSAAQDGFKNEEKNKTMRSTMVWAMLAGATLQSSITIMYGILRNGYDEEREYELDFFYEFIRNFTGMFPSLSVEVLNGLLSAIDNAPWTGDIASNPVFSLLENAIKATAALKESMDEDKPEFIRDRKYQEGVRQGADALAKIFGAPTVAVNFIVKQALLEDKK